MQDQLFSLLARFCDFPHGNNNILIHIVWVWGCIWNIVYFFVKVAHLLYNSSLSSCVISLNVASQGSPSHMNTSLRSVIMFLCGQEIQANIPSLLVVTEFSSLFLHTMPKQILTVYISFLWLSEEKGKFISLVYSEEEEVNLILIIKFWFPSVSWMTALFIFL